MQRTVLRVWTIGALALALLFLAVPTVLAADSTRVLDHGFWWQGNTGVGPATAPPDVERGHLLVEAAPTGATAIAAIRGQLQDGHGSPTITLDVVNESGGATAVLLACHAGSGWTGMYAGRFDAKPSVDCDSGSVQAIRAEDGASWDLPIGPLQFGDQFNIVLVPGADPDSGVVAPFRIVFDQPRADGITTVIDAPAPPASTPTTLAVEPTPASAGPSAQPSFSAPESFTPAPAPRSSFTPPAPAAAPTRSVAPVAPALPAADLGQTATAPLVSAQSQPLLPAIDETDVGRLRLFGLAMLVIGATTGVLWWRDERAVPLRAVVAGVDAQMLENLQAVAAEPTEGGLGRFRRERTGDAPKLF